MAKENENILSSGENIKPQRKSIKRRTLLKALAGIPVLGIFSFEVLKKWEYEQQKKNRLIEELGLKNLEIPVKLKSSEAKISR